MNLDEVGRNVVNEVTLLVSALDDKLNFETLTTGGKNTTEGGKNTTEGC